MHLIFLPDARKLRISQDICYMRATYIEFTMTIFGQCHNVLNNKGEYTPPPPHPGVSTHLFASRPISPHLFSSNLILTHHTWLYFLDLTVIAVGVGSNIKLSELRFIATDKKRHVFTAKNFDQLLKLVTSLRKKACTGEFQCIIVY